MDVNRDKKGTVLYKSNFFFTLGPRGFMHHEDVA